MSNSVNSSLLAKLEEISTSAKSLTRGHRYTDPALLSWSPASLHGQRSSIVPGDALNAENIPLSTASAGVVPLGSAAWTGIKVLPGVLHPGFIGIKDWTGWFDHKIGKVRLIPDDGRVNRQLGPKTPPFSHTVRFKYLPLNSTAQIVAGTGSIIAPRLILTAAHVFLGHSDALANPHQSRVFVDLFDGNDDLGVIHKVHFRQNYLSGRPFDLHDATETYNFVQSDIAIVETCHDLVPPGEQVFSYGKQSALELQLSNLAHLGYAMNANGMPCRDQPVDPHPNYLGLPFGRCRGDLYSQHGQGSMLESFTQDTMSVWFDVTQGHSGGPIYVIQGGKRVIWGVMSLSVSGNNPNLAHRISAESAAWIDSIVAKTSGSPTCNLPFSPGAALSASPTLPVRPWRRPGSRDHLQDISRPENLPRRDGQTDF